MKNFLFFLLVLLGMCSSADAHQIKTSGSLSVLQHSDPNDEPRAGTTTVLYLHFSDTKDVFAAAQCDCVAYVIPYADVASVPLSGEAFDFASSKVQHLYNENYSFEYVFPKRNIYAIVVEGSPKDGTLFDPFRIVFDLRVDKGSASNDENLAWNDAGVRADDNLSIQLTTAFLIMSIPLGILIYKRFYIKK